MILRQFLQIFYQMEFPNNLKINGSQFWGYNRYRPTLLVKNFDVEKPEITYKSELVLLNDLAKTICLKVDLEIDCEIFPGVDLLGDSLESDDPYYIYVVQDNQHRNEFRFRGHISVKIPSRKFSFFEALKNSKQVRLSP